MEAYLLPAESSECLVLKGMEKVRAMRVEYMVQGQSMEI